MPAALAGVAVVARRPVGSPGLVCRAGWPSPGARPGGARGGGPGPDHRVGRVPGVHRRLAGPARMAAEIDDEVEVLSLDPVSVEGVLNAIQAVGAMTEAEDAAMDVVESLRERLQAVETIVVARREHGFVPPRVAALEWLDPPTAVGRWVPEQVRLAGRLGAAGARGRAGRAHDVGRRSRSGPEMLVLMPVEPPPRRDGGGLGGDAAPGRLGRPARRARRARVRHGRGGALRAAGPPDRRRDRAAGGDLRPARVRRDVAPGSWARVG